MLFPEDTVYELSGFWIAGLKEAFLLMPILAPEAFRSSYDGLKLLDSGKIEPILKFAERMCSDDCFAAALESLLMLIISGLPMD